MGHLQLRAVSADRGLDVQFSVSAGEVLAVLGPNGAGKSTALHVVAGLVRPDTGLVRLGERVLTDTEAGIEVATHDRRVGLLLQDPLLFPHLSAAANVAFGLRERRTGRAGRRGSALRWLHEVDAGQLSERKPGQLSGGQARRVAIARALAAEPEVLLLDEPLAGLDVAAAAGIRAVLRNVAAREGRAIVLVTHDVLDVLTLADRVLVLEAGKVAEAGPVTDVFTAPRSRFAARLAGVNLVAGTLGDDGALHAPCGTRWYGIAETGLTAGRNAVALFSPAAVAVEREPRHTHRHNSVSVTVAELDTRGAAIRVRGEEQPDGAPGLAADITADVAAELRLIPGERIWFWVDTGQIGLHAAAPQRP